MHTTLQNPASHLTSPNSRDISLTINNPLLKVHSLEQTLLIFHVRHLKSVSVMFSEDSRALENMSINFVQDHITRSSIVQSFPIQVFDWHQTAGPSLTLHLVNLKHSWELIWYYNLLNPVLSVLSVQDKVKLPQFFGCLVSDGTLGEEALGEKVYILAQLWVCWMCASDSVIFSCVSNSQVICGQSLLLKWHKGLVHSMKLSIVIICSCSCHSKPQKEYKMTIPANFSGFSFAFQL